MELQQKNGVKALFQEIFKYLRYVTVPIFLLIITIFTSLIVGKLSDIDHKIFDHLTNGEIHIPREQIVSQAQFSLQKQMTDWKYDGMLSNQKQILLDLNTIKEEIKGLTVSIAKIK